ncbi:glycosyltransferase family 4 protein [Allomuricauda taeanensis]|uniref:glycosyltransferase family 4 protein n=1 Tax=Flagellimonas taeanensis TaxID=1005926 RepID=UPI002E7B3B21|nr:glycosyltransferase family 4 protein [Allomuricauda taeanensis]MEE1961621.1 glycosyltransferase family 4 protein [Allomuricauda taeanensis]
MKILFLTDNFPPEFNAPASRTYAHCKEWVRQGAEVTVITGAPNFPKGKVFEGYKNRWKQTEEMDGIRVIRVWTYIAANEGFLKRTLDFISFMFTSFSAGIFVKTDVIVATSPQFFTAIAGRWLSFFKRKPWIMEVRDIWPESIKAVGAMEGNLAIRYFEYLEKRMYKSASKIVTVTDSFKQQLVEKHNISQDKIGVFKNGVDTTIFQPISKDEDLLHQIGLQGKFVIGYIGTHGMAHKLDFVLKSAKLIEDKDIHFLFLGTGAERENLLRLKGQLKLDNVTMLDSVPKSEVSKYISILDVGLVNLKKSKTFESVIPSKIFELAAMHKPILLGVSGESKEMVEEYNVGVGFEPENSAELIYKINYLKENQNKEYGFEEFVSKYKRENLAKQMLLFIKE